MPYRWSGDSIHCGWDRPNCSLANISRRRPRDWSGRLQPELLYCEGDCNQRTCNGRQRDRRVWAIRGGSAGSHNHGSKWALRRSGSDYYAEQPSRCLGVLYHRRNHSDGEVDAVYGPVAAVHNGDRSPGHCAYREQSQQRCCCGGAASYPLSPAVVHSRQRPVHKHGYSVSAELRSRSDNILLDRWLRSISAV